MSEENNQSKQAPATGGEKREHHHNHRRGGQNHRGHKGKGEKRPHTGEGDGKKPAQNNQPREQKPNEGEPRQGKGGSQSQKKNNNNRQGRNHADRERGRGGNRGNRRHEMESRLYDPYEAPDKEEAALSELRARIVIKAADGTVPEPLAPLSPISPIPTPAPAEPTAEQLREAADAAAAILDKERSGDGAFAQAEQQKVEVIGVRFRSSSKTYYFDPKGIAAKKGDFAIVETARGPEFGEIKIANCMVSASETVAPLRPLLRIATPADIAHNAENQEKEKRALEVCREKVRAYKLDMNLIEVQYAFDNSKLLFYFSSEGRVDFRDLVKDLASVFRTRIELRQIGIRDEAKMLGGIGACGRALCCSTFLPDFAQVSIKMAKDQGLSLNTTKISGVCGRLMCCLRFESDVYTEEIKKTPANDTLVKTEDGEGVVIGSNPLAGTVRVLLKDAKETTPKQYHRDAVTVIGKESRADRPKKEKPADKDKKEAGKKEPEKKEPEKKEPEKKEQKDPEKQETE